MNSLAGIAVDSVLRHSPVGMSVRIRVRDAGDDADVYGIGVGTHLHVHSGMTARRIDRAAKSFARETRLMQAYTTFDNAGLIK